MSSFPSRSIAAPRGFTLIEMLVVVTIMAVLTTIAVQSLAPVAQKSHVEATERTLDSVTRALITANQSSGTTSISGFVADMRRLPNPVAELWVDQPLPWRGPYLLPPGNSLSIVDGWGTALQFSIADGALDSLNDVLVVSSNGTNRTSEWAVVNSDDVVRRIPVNQLSARDLQIRLYGVDTQGASVDVTSMTPQVTVRAVGDDRVITPVLTTAVVGTQGTPKDKTYLLDANAFLAAGSASDEPEFLVGAYTVSVTGVTVPSSGPTGMPYNDQVVRVNLLPSTSNYVELLIFRADVATPSTGADSNSSAPPPSSD